MRTEGDGLGDRGVVGDAAVDQLAAAPPHRGQHPGNGRAGQHRLDDRSGREQDFFAGQDVDGDHVQRDRELLEARGADVLGQQVAQAGGGDQVVARPEKAEQSQQRVQREHLGASGASPARRQLVGGGHRRRVRCDERSVDGPDRRATTRSGRMPRS